MMLRKYPTSRQMLRRAGRKLGGLARGACLVAALCGASIAQASPTPEELEARVRALTEQLQALQAEVAAMKAAPTADAAAQAQASTLTQASTPAPAEPALSWFGYGEATYTRPEHGTATADLARFVLGASYRFDERTRFVSELEIEHAVSSADDAGEVEVEQAYVERAFGAHLYGRAGLMLIPLGLLNETHEPTRYYGVQRNGVETAIIPTTWREGGIALEGRSDGGWRWNLGLTTGFDLSKWDAASSEGLESPLGAIHQELSGARAADLSGFAAVNYTGIPGLRAGAGVFAGGVGQDQPGLGSAGMSLWEAHLRWTPGDFSLAGLYARGHISGTAALNRASIGLPTPVPADFDGWYAEAAWRGLRFGTSVLAPFLRYERYNTAAGYATLAPGLTPQPLAATRVWIGGLNYDITEGVVVKADYLDQRGPAPTRRFDLGLGYAF
ncbi:MAG: hypothetical protein U1F06_08440 [Steroidobacteraceae bacterium]